MISPCLDAIDRFASKRVLVIGEAMLDSYMLGSSTRLCQEAPVPVVAVRERLDRPGGAANTAANLAALGCQVGLLSVVGADGEGDRLRALLERQGVGTDLLAVCEDRRTLAKQRVVNGDHLVVRVDQGDTGPVGHEAERLLCARLDAALVHTDAVVISDYGYGVVADRLLARLRMLQRRHAQLVAVDARDLLRYRTLGVTVVKPNYAEALRLAGISSESLQARPEQARAALVSTLGRVILDRTGSRIAAITLDADGAVIVERGQPPYRTYARPTDQRRTAGAGDTYLAALALALTSGAPTQIAAEIAAGAAAVVVAQETTATCAASALRGVLGEDILVPLNQPDRDVSAGAGGAAPGQPATPGRVATSNRGPRDRGRQGDSTNLGDGRATALHQA